MLDKTQLTSSNEGIRVRIGMIHEAVKKIIRPSVEMSIPAFLCEYIQGLKMEPLTMLYFIFL